MATKSIIVNSDKEGKALNCDTLLSEIIIRLPEGGDLLLGRDPFVVGSYEILPQFKIETFTQKAVYGGGDKIFVVLYCKDLASGRIHEWPLVGLIRPYPISAKREDGEKDDAYEQRMAQLLTRHNSWFREQDLWTKEVEVISDLLARLFKAGKFRITATYRRGSRQYCAIKLGI